MLERRACSLGLARQALTLSCALGLLACTEPQYGNPDAALHPVDPGPDGRIPGLLGPDGRVAPGPDVDPSQPDGGTDVPSNDDAGPLDDAGLFGMDQPPKPGQLAPEWSVSLQGDYVTRQVLFSRETTIGTQSSHEILSSVQIAYDERTGETTLRLHMCRDHVNLFVGQSGSVKHPTDYPTRFLLLKYAQGEFHTESMKPDFVGYSELPPAGCTPGKKLPRTPTQAWLSDTCDCPANIQDLPESTSDCRVIDSDNDGKPGFTIQLNGTVNTNDYVVSRDFSQMVHGTIAANGRHRAAYLVNQDTYQVQCDGSCTRGNFVNCQATANPVDFIRLVSRPDGAPVPCPDALKLVDDGMLFPTGTPVFPSSGC